LAQAGYIYPNTKLDIETQVHLRSDLTARPFDISFNPNPTSHHCCPYTTIGADITITGTTPPPKRQTSEDIIQTITANADHHLQMHERRKLGRTTKPATPTTPPVHGDEVIDELYNKNMVLIPITIDPFACFGPMFQSFLTSTESRPQEPLFTTHRNNKFNRPYANLMYERASKPPCTLGSLTSADFFWKQSDSPTRRTFYGTNSYTAPTPSIHTIQQLGLTISKSYSSLLTNATRKFQRPPTAPRFDLYSFLAHSEDTYPIDT
jgi:hypothetical protein